MSDRRGTWGAGLARPMGGAALRLALIAVLLGVVGASPGLAMEQCADSARVTYGDPVLGEGGPFLAAPTQVSVGADCDGTSVVLRHLDAAGESLGVDWTGVVVDGRADVAPSEPARIRIAEVKSLEVEIRYPGSDEVLGEDRERGGPGTLPAPVPEDVLPGPRVLPLNEALPRTGADLGLMALVGVLTILAGALAVRRRRRTSPTCDS